MSQFIHGQIEGQIAEVLQSAPALYRHHPPARMTSFIPERQFQQNARPADATTADPATRDARDDNQNENK